MVAISEWLARYSSGSLAGGFKKRFNVALTGTTRQFDGKLALKRVKRFGRIVIRRCLFRAILRFLYETSACEPSPGTHVEKSALNKTFALQQIKRRIDPAFNRHVCRCHI